MTNRKNNFYGKGNLLRISFCVFSILIFSLLGCSALFGAPSRKGRQFVSLITNGDAQIAIKTEGLQDEKKAAQIIKTSIEKMSHTASVSIDPPEDNVGNKLLIRICKSLTTPLLTPNTKDVEDALKFKFVIGTKSILIEYPQDTSPLNAVGIFLKKFCDVYFLVPSPIGTELNNTQNLKLRTGIYEVNPSYKGRQLGIYSHVEFAQLIGNCDTFTAENHLLPRIIDADIAAQHPQWLANIDGVLQPHKHSTQIDFNDTGARLFIKNFTDKFFTENPTKRIISLSPADSDDFDNTAHSERLKRGYSRDGYRDCSNLIFGFTNDVAKFLEIKNPDKFIYSLAYLHTQLPPSFKLEDNIIVYLCLDRGNFFSQEYKNYGTSLLEKWRSSGVKFFGIYDYNYGNPYFIPRNISEQIAYSIKSSHKIGARFYTAETYPNWAYDAHKIWLISNLLINVDANSQQLEKEFFDLYYKEAAKPISDFFAIAQSQWNKRFDNPIWLSLYKRFSQAQVFSKESLDDMQNCLTKAEQIALKEPVISRVKEIRMMFDITKSFVRTYELEKELWLLNPEDSQNRARIEDLIEAIKISKAIKKLNIETYYNNTKYPKSDFGIWDKLDYLDISQTRLAEINNPKTPAKNILKDSDFKTAFFIKNGVWKTKKSDNARLKIEKTNNGGLKISSLLPAYLYQNLEVKEGKKYSFNINVSGNLDIGAIFYTELSFYDAQDKLLNRRRLRIPALGNFDKIKMSMQQIAPPTATYAIAAIFAMNMRESDCVEIDDANLLEWLENPN